MKKEAQKGVKDPVQKKLRDNKKQWSKDTSTLIAQLIAFKRGLNGRGDPRAGLPASNIKDPLPDEVKAYMNQMVQRFQEITDRASKIIDEQSQYSQNRRKPKEESPQQQQQVETSMPVAAALKHDLEKNARLLDKSSRVTRFIAYVMQYPWFAGEENEIIKAKLGLMYAAADFENRLNEIEYALTSFDKNSQSKAFYDFSRFIILFQRRFMDIFDETVKKQAEFYSKNEDTIGPPPERPEKPQAVAEAEAKNEEERNQEQQAAESQTETARQDGNLPDKAPNSPGNEKEEEGNAGFEETAEDTLKVIEIKTSDIFTDLGGALFLSQLADAYAKKYAEDDSVNKVMPAAVLEGVDKLRKDADTVRKAAKAGKMEGLMDNYQSVVERYNNHVGGLAKTWGTQANTIYGIIKELQPKLASSSDKILRKLASKHKLERWMQRVRLSIYTDQYEVDRLQTARLLRDAADDLDIIQELLEKKDVILIDVGLYVQKLYNTLGELCKYFAYIGKYHNYMYGSERSVGTKPTLGQINTDQIRILEKYGDIFEAHANDLASVTMENKKEEDDG